MTAPEEHLPSVHANEGWSVPGTAASPRAVIAGSRFVLDRRPNITGHQHCGAKRRTLRRSVARPFELARRHGRPVYSRDEEA